MDFFRHKDRYLTDDEEHFRKFNWGAVVGVVGGALAGNFIPFGIAAINAMIVAVACYFVAELVYNKKAA